MDHETVPTKIVQRQQQQIIKPNFEPLIVVKQNSRSSSTVVVCVMFLCRFMIYVPRVIATPALPQSVCSVDAAASRSPPQRTKNGVSSFFIIVVSTPPPPSRVNGFLTTTTTKQRNGAEKSVIVRCCNVVRRKRGRENKNAPSQNSRKANWFPPPGFPQFSSSSPPQGRGVETANKITSQFTYPKRSSSISEMVGAEDFRPAFTAFCTTRHLSSACERVWSHSTPSPSLPFFSTCDRICR